eukprot:4991980-Amphidinium_carterae.1
MREKELNTGCLLTLSFGVPDPDGGSIGLRPERVPQHLPGDVSGRILARGFAAQSLQRALVTLECFLQQLTSLLEGDQVSGCQAHQ